VTTKRSEKAKYILIKGDCVEAALWLKREKKTNPVVLNMANRFQPGGGYLDGR
jgi:hypothetical protein